MKKVRPWIFVISFLIAVISWGVIGLKLYDGDYNITVEAYTMMACLVVILLCTLSRFFTDKCSYCGKLRVSNGIFCPHCGKEL